MVRLAVDEKLVLTFTADENNVELVAQICAGRSPATDVNKLQKKQATMLHTPQVFCEHEKQSADEKVTSSKTNNKTK